MAAGVRVGNYTDPTHDPWGNPINSTQINNNTPESTNKLYNTGVATNAGDYDSIMQGYKDILNNSPKSPTGSYTPQNYTPSSYAPAQYSASTYKYKPTSDYESAVGNLRGLASDGGYSPQGIADLRARGVSPIRSIYSSAQSNLDRQKALQGGYSPGYTAATTKMARELSDQIASKVQDVNAGIAQNVASNKVAASVPLASVTGQENALSANVGEFNTNAQNTASASNANASNQANAFNTNATNEANRFNAGAGNEASRFNLEFPFQFNNINNQNRLQALHGMQGLYGTTPALASLFGNQALSAAQLQNIVDQQNRQAGLGAIGDLARTS